VIAAGSTGSIPATAELLRQVASLPQGSVILPGLDLVSDDETWVEIAGDPGHPQYGMAQLLRRFGLRRDAVAVWGENEMPGVDPARAAFANLALRPPRATARWHDARRDDFAAALDGVQRVDCSDSGEEALVIALLLRRQAEQPGSTAALVIPDRDLARRVAVNLQRWQIEVDDSAGRSLANTPPGVFLRLTAEMAAERFAPVALLAALKHPLAAGGQASGAFRRAVRSLERTVLRGPRPAPGLDGLREALTASKAAADLRPWFDSLAGILQPLAEALSQANRLSDIVEAHIAAAEALAASAEEAGGDRLWAGDAGEAAAGFFAELREAAVTTPVAQGFHYPAALEALMAGRAVRPRYGLHPRIAILGPLEARLQQADVLVLGGLNEGTWPAQVDPGPWLSRPMQSDFGLPLPERRIGLAAHDFFQGFCAPRVYLTRAERVEGTPTVPARWLRRIAALSEGLGLESDLYEESARLKSWAAALDQPAQVVPTAPPRPCPPVEARPRELSVTRIETWMGDPYALYAREILRLRPLDPLDADPGAAERGTLVHEALEKFLRAHPRDLPADALEQLREIGAEVFHPIRAKPGAYAFWWPRFLRVAGWFLGEERARRAEIAESFVEIDGRLQFNAPGGRFTLIAKADRIDRRQDGSLEIIDYKTGTPPNKKRVDRGFAPQLPLEAAIVAEGGFEGLAPGPIAALTFWRLSGGSPPGEILAAGKADPEVLAAEALAGLQRLVAEFDNPSTPYLCQPRPDLAPRFNDYAHLSRLAEWSVAEDPA
jgi:ATP-dependent helicase/nuclease subunit B